MKNIVKRIEIISFAFMALLMSCFDDKSTLPTIEYPDLVVDRTGEAESFMISYGSVFTYEPKLGRLVDKDTLRLTADEYDQYNYVWKSTLTSSNDTTSRVISHERILKNTMVFAPSPGTSNYGLSLEVTHKISGVTKRFNWNFKILGTYGLGLLVADTRNEKESDLSLIMSVSYNNNMTNYDQDTVHRNIFSLAHGAPVDGLVSSMVSTVNKTIKIVIPGKSLIELDPVTLQEIGRDFDLFYYKPASYNPQIIFPTVYGTNCVLMNDNVAQSYAGSSKFSFVAKDNDYRFSDFCMPYYKGNGQAVLFDLNQSKFVVFSTKPEAPYIEMSPGGVFDPTQMAGVEPIFGGDGNNSTGRCLVKKDNKYYIYEFNQVSSKYMGVRIYDMSGCVDLEKATCYSFSTGFAEFYYGVEGKLHVAILNQDTPSSHIAYDKFGSNEKLTHILLLNTLNSNGNTTWSEDGTGAPIWNPSNKRLLSVATYNELTKEGRIYTLPIQYAGDGGIAAEKYVRCYKKFGRIITIGARL